MAAAEPTIEDTTMLRLLASELPFEALVDAGVGELRTLRFAAALFPRVYALPAELDDPLPNLFLAGGDRSRWLEERASELGGVPVLWRVGGGSEDLDAIGTPAAGSAVFVASADGSLAEDELRARLRTEGGGELEPIALSEGWLLVDADRVGAIRARLREAAIAAEAGGRRSGSEVERERQRGEALAHRVTALERELAAVRRSRLRLLRALASKGTLNELRRRLGSTPAPGPAPPTVALCSALGPAGGVERTVLSMLRLAGPGPRPLVHHDGSDQQGFERLESEAKDVRFASAPVFGAGHGLTLAFDHADGAEVAICVPAGAELLAPGIEGLATAFAADPGLDAAYGDLIITGSEAATLQPLPAHDDRVLDWLNPAWPGPLAVRRESWERAGARFEPELDHHWAWELLLRLRKAGGRIRQLPVAVAAVDLPSGEAAESAGREAGTLRRRVRGGAIGGVELDRVLLRRRALIQLLARLERIRRRP